MRDCFTKLGVPASHIAMIADRDATRRNIRKHLRDVLRQTQPGDFLWFSYQGHGDKRPNSGMFLVPYDTDGSTNKSERETAYKLSDLLSDIESDFRGSHVLLSGDCCHSGQMAAVAPHRKGRIAFGAITSSLSSEVSTGNWTFTNALIEGLTGQGAVDLDRDGFIDLKEIGRYARTVMAFEEEQLSSFGFAEGFPKKTGITSVKTAAKAQVGKQVEIHRKEGWQKAVVTDTQANGDVRVRLAKEPEPLDRWFTADRVRDYTAVKIPKGARVEVKYKGKWLKATVEAEQLGIHHVRFDGDRKDDDEWVSSRRIRLLK
ncbi:MAG: caspase family protein [Ilumatobacteraceae bacterium]|nr:caspase family protein [Ilumatobacteraceae bacterium]